MGSIQNQADQLAPHTPPIHVNSETLDGGHYTLRMPCRTDYLLVSRLYLHKPQLFSLGRIYYALISLCLDQFVFECTNTVSGYTENIPCHCETMCSTSSMSIGIEPEILKISPSSLVAITPKP